MGISAALGSSALLPAGLGFRNKIINGDMRIAQRATTASLGSATFTYSTVDRWAHEAASLFGNYTMTQETDAPSGFGNSLKIIPVSAMGSSFSTTKMVIGQRIEANNLADFAKGTASAKTFTLSFWVKSYVTGTYAIEISDDVNTRNISTTYTVNASATWEYKAIQIPADSTGTIPVSVNAGLRVNFWIRAGTNFTGGTTNTWATTSNANRAVGHTVNGLAVTDSWQITGVQLEANYQPTPFEQRPISVELALCQRYYQRLSYQTTNYIAIGQVYPTNNAYAVVDLPTTLRTPATSITVSGTTFALDSGGVGRGITVAMANATTTNIGINATGSFNLTNGHAALLAFSTAPNYIELNGTEL